MFAKVKVENILWVNCRKRGSHIQPSVWEKKQLALRMFALKSQMYIHRIQKT